MRPCCRTSGWRGGLATTTRRRSARLAYSIERLGKECDISRSMIYEEIAAGRLIARKIGRRTIVRRSDALLWLRSLPPLDPTERNGATSEKTESSSSGQRHND